MVSSKLEAKHFIELGGYQPEEIYNSGLVKLDRSVSLDPADQIAIMPTWRPWELLSCNDNLIQTSYYKFIEKIYGCIPDEYLHKVVILPHPMVAVQMKKIPGRIGESVMVTENYDKVLQKTSLLITDYSSISFDVFFRGANVLFYWEEKETCLQKYGEKAKLMLTPDLAFGDICESTAQLRKAIGTNYLAPQKELYKTNYLRIVEHHDRQNAKRLVEMLEEDHLL